MFKYEIKMNGEVIGTRSSKNVYTHVSAQKFAREYNNLSANSEYHAKEFNNATFSVLEITPDMVTA
jgi:hypothetical protein